MRTKKIFAVIFAFVLVMLGTCFASPTNKSEAYYCESGLYYEGDGSVSVEHRNIYTFDYYEMNDTHLERLCPNYTNHTQLNSCAPMAGSIVLGYYDYEFPNLIPEIQTCVLYEGKYRYTGLKPQVVDAKEKLYDYMGTNTEAPGTSLTQFKNGFKRYVNEAGYGIQYNTCGSTLNVNTLINYLNAGQPVVLFVGGYDYFPEVGMYFGENRFEFLGRSSTNGHVVVAFGYRQYKFYTNGVLTQTENFISIAFGDGSQGFLSLTSSATVIDAALAINIY